MPETEKGRGLREPKSLGHQKKKKDSGLGSLFSKPEEVYLPTPKDKVCFGIKKGKGLFAKLFKISLRVYLPWYSQNRFYLSSRGQRASEEVTKGEEVITVESVKLVAKHTNSWDMRLC